MRVKEKELSYALQRSPTLHWGATLRQAVAIIKAATLCKYDGVWIVDDKAWDNAMSLCRALPAGGRHVAQEWRDMWRNIRAATTFN